MPDDTGTHAASAELANALSSTAQALMHVKGGKDGGGSHAEAAITKLEAALEDIKNAIALSKGQG